MIQKPIELLQGKLTDYEKALQKSFISFRDKKITEQEHLIHKNNLNHIIFSYKHAIETLKNWS